MAIVHNVIPLTVTDRVISVGAYIAPTAGNVGVDFVSIELDSNWDGYEYYVDFYSDNMQPLTFAWDGESEIEIPWEVIAKKGRMRVTVKGLDDDGNIRMLTYNMKRGIMVVQPGEDPTVDPDEETLDIITKAVKAIEKAEEISATFEENETERQDTFDSNETERQNTFDTNEAERGRVFSTNEMSRSSQFTNAQTERAETFQGNMSDWGEMITNATESATTAADAANNAADSLAERVQAGEFNGAAFEVKYTPVSISAMQAIPNPKQGEFACIQSNVEDPDNSKLYMYGNGQWNFITDLSGAIGIKGDQGVQGVSLKNVQVVDMTKVEVTQYNPETQQDRTYIIGDFAQPLAAGIEYGLNQRIIVTDQATFDAMTEYAPNVIYGVRM